jgi:TRAP-type C4-dicarboxylate transport system permease small subunit
MADRAESRVAEVLGKVLDFGELLYVCCAFLCCLLLLLCWRDTSPMATLRFPLFDPASGYFYFPCP